MFLLYKSQDYENDDHEQLENRGLSRGKKIKPIRPQEAPLPALRPLTQKVLEAFRNRSPEYAKPRLEIEPLDLEEFNEVSLVCYASWIGPRSAFFLVSDFKIPQGSPVRYAFTSSDLKTRYQCSYVANKHVLEWAISASLDMPILNPALSSTSTFVTFSWGQ